MTDAEILQKAIEKAYGTNNIFFQFGHKYEISFIVPGKKMYEFRTLYNLIFSHDFAKAFFPKTDEHGFHKDDAWKYYLQQMILEDNPLHYLKKFL